MPKSGLTNAHGYNEWPEDVSIDGEIREWTVSVLPFDMGIGSLRFVDFNYDDHPWYLTTPESGSFLSNLEDAMEQDPETTVKILRSIAGGHSHSLT